MFSQIGDTGNFDTCQKITYDGENVAHLCVCDLAILGPGLGLFQGLCLPDSCESGDMPNLTIPLQNQNISCKLACHTYCLSVPIRFVWTNVWMDGWIDELMNRRIGIGLD